MATWEERAAQEEAADGLAWTASLFYKPPGQIYLDGNSLGLLSVKAEASLLRVLGEWKARAIGGWTDAEPAWFFLAETLGKMTAPLIGAAPEEVIVANSTTVNLHQLLATLYRPDSTRTKILADALLFPSDRYALQSFLRLRGLAPAEHLVLAESADGLTLDEDALIAAMTPDVQMAVFPAVLYGSGQLLDIPKLTAAAHKRGIVIGFDCAHSIGSVPHALSAWGVDFAFWCSYKYLNAGPGATGGLYLNRRHFGTTPGLAGWFGSKKETQFGFGPELEAADAAGGLQIGTPNLLSMAPLQGSLELFAEIGIERLRARSLKLTAFLRERIENEIGELGVRVVTPLEAARRGGHLALAHPDAAQICNALRKAGVIPDFRPPSIIRLAPVPLYISFAECGEAVEILKHLLQNSAYKEEEGRSLVP